MLNQIELQELTRRLSLPESAWPVINQIRSSPPQRRVRNAAGNVVTRYPSRKMGMTIQAESHRVELAAVLCMEYDEQVLEYYDQVPAIKLNYLSKAGKPIGVLHTPDFFVICSDWIGWEEWKTEEHLRRLKEEMPHRFVLGEGDLWRCPPGEHYAASVGLGYRVRSSREIDWVFQRNIHFLEDYWRADGLTVSTRTQSLVIQWLHHEAAMSLQDLLARGRSADINADAIYALIAQEAVHVDLSAAPLAEPQHVCVFVDRETCLAYQACQSAMRIATPTTGLAAQPMPDEVRERLACASPPALQEAARRYRLIQPTPSANASHDLPSDTPARTLRRWRSAYLQAEQAYGNGFVGLLPKTARCGNRTARLSAEVITVMDSVIVEHYETVKQKSIRAAYGEVVQQCQERALSTPSYKSFANAIRRRPAVDRILHREGPRAAYAHQTFYWVLDLATPRHGDRPFELGHIDHTELDIELVCSQTGRNLGRPWATFLMDAYSRRMLALWLTFEEPSFRTCMMILRECVRRHGRLPQTIVADGGREFDSMYFEVLLAQYGCTKKTRPSGQPRHGSVCERLFGTANTTFVHNLIGNTQGMRHERQVTQSVNPKTHATWTLGKLSEALCQWAYELYDTLDHPALGQSPREAFEQGLQQSGERAHKAIAYDESFIVATLPYKRRSSALLRANRGVQINRIAYWSDAFRNPDVQGKQVPVRYDPFDAGVAYAYVGGRWTRCISEHYAQFKGRSELEIALISEELNRRNRLHRQQFKVTSAHIAAFIRTAETTEAILRQQQRDAEGKHALQAIVAQPPALTASSPDTMAPALPEEPSPGVATSESTPSRKRGSRRTKPSSALRTYGDY